MQDKYIPIRPHMETIAETAKLFGVSAYFVRKLALSEKSLPYVFRGAFSLIAINFPSISTLPRWNQRAKATAPPTIYVGYAADYHIKNKPSVIIDRRLKSK